jgi:hypothetical protein
MTERLTVAIDEYGYAGIYFALPPDLAQAVMVEALASTDRRLGDMEEGEWAWFDSDRDGIGLSVTKEGFTIHFQAQGPEGDYLDGTKTPTRLGLDDRLRAACAVKKILANHIGELR